ncbi:MAG: ATP-binding protein [Vulcanisaeta sp.]|nr:ATP-binding protein [Vulcanisaeta sp.]
MGGISNSRSLGKVLGDPPPDLHKAYAKPNAGVYLYPGELLKAPSSLPNHSVLLRVINYKKVNKLVSADALNVYETMGLKVETDGFPLGSYDIAELQVLDCFDTQNQVLKGNICVPLPNGALEPIDEQLLISLFGGKRPDKSRLVEIGDIKIGERSMKLLIDPDIFIRHVLVIGSTGTGKSWFRGVIMEKFKEKGIYQVNFDPLGEYSEAVRQLGGVNIRIGRDMKLPLWTLTPAQFYDLIYDYIPTEFQRTIAVEAFKRVRARRGDRYDLVKEVGKVSEEMNAREDTYLNTVNRLNVFLDTLGITGNDDPKKIASILNTTRLLNFDFVGLNELQRDYAVASIMTLLYEFRDPNHPLIDKPVLVAIDEAHLYVPSSKRTLSREIIKNVLRYGRHVGLALMLITQLPSSMDEEAVEMPAVKIIFSISYDQLRGIRFALSDLPDDIIYGISKMETGRAIITGNRDLIRYSIVVDITKDRKTRHGAPTPSFFG